MSSSYPPTLPRPQTRLVMVRTSSLDIACEVSGPEGGTPVVLSHGWPDSVRTWDRVLPDMHRAGYQTFVPHLRGFGETRFRSAATPRRASLSSLGNDLVELIEGLSLRKPHVIGHDWGARASYIASCIWPEGIRSCVAISVGWGTNHPEQRLSYGQAQNYWYHWYMALPQGERVLRNEYRDFTRYIWDVWNPGVAISDEEFNEAAVAFDNPDWTDVVLHSYRVRWGLAEADDTALALEERIAADPSVRIPTLVLHGGADPCNEPATSEGKERFFTSRYERVVLPDLGHFPQRQAPQEVIKHVVPFLSRET